MTETVIHLHTDHLNTPRTATNADGTVVWGWAGEAFGATRPDTDPDGDGVPLTMNLRFPGQYYDQESGLHYNWHRYYDPRLGRYITSDPIGLDGGLNTYLYTGANPLHFIDPNGLLSCTYEIWIHKLTCTNNSGQTMTTMEVKAGLEECQDLPKCTDRENEGPLPVGNYTIFSPSQTGHKGWMFLGKNFLHRRGGFFIHPWGISNGCISIFLNSDYQTLSDWAEQDDGGSLSVME